MKTAKELKDLLGFDLFLTKRTWYFRDGKFRKQAILSTTDKTPVLRVSTTEDKLQQFEKNFEIITTSHRSYRVTFLNSYGIAEYFLPPPLRTIDANTTIMVAYRPSLMLYEMLGGKKTPMEPDNISGEIPGFEHWFQQGLLDFSRQNREFKQKKDLYQEIQVGDILKVTLSLDFDTDYSRNSFKAIHDSYAKIDFTRKRNYSSAISLFKSVEEFFNFVFPEVTNQYHYVSTVPRKSKQFHSRIDIIAPVYAEQGAPKQRDRYGIMFGILDVSNSGDLIKNWVYRYPKLERAWEEFKTIKTGNLSDKARFLSLVNAIEDVHRTFFENISDDEKADFKKRLKTIADQVSNPDDKKLIKTRLRNAYEPPLLKRIMDIYHLAMNYGVPQIGNDVIEKAVTTRHDLIHSLKTDRNKLLTPGEMFEINQRFAIYFKIAVLKLIGMTDDDVKNVVSKSSQFKPYYRD